MKLNWGMFLIIGILLFGISCTKNTTIVNNYGDKEVRIDFPYGMSGGVQNIGDTTYNSIYSVSNEINWMSQFDISNYQNYDSLFYICKTGSFTRDTCIFDLFDETNKKPIPGSQKIYVNNLPIDPQHISSYVMDFKSDNFLSSMPKQPINIAFRVLVPHGKNKDNIGYVAINSASLILKRK